MNEHAYPGFEFDQRWRRLVCPEDYRNPEPKRRYHLAVIGAGPAGLMTAIAAAGLGARVALIERKAMGGDCLNVGCVPSKALLETAASGAGFDAAFAWLRRVRAEIAVHDSVERYTRAGVDVFLGNARCIDSATVGVGELRLSARRIVIATGARPSIPPIPGLRAAEPLTNETVFELRRQPRRLAVIGAGPVGCELAQAMARLHVEVHLFESADRVLSRESPEASRIVAAALRNDGVRLQLGAAIDSVERRGPMLSLISAHAATEVDALVVAAGRTANVDALNLAGVGVETTADGLISVDARLRTSNPKIFAAGDVCSRDQFTHNADAQARIVVQNALFLPTASTKPLAIPHCTYTDPEVARVGAHRTELDAAGTAFDVYRAEFGDLDRGKTQADTIGFAEVLTERHASRILGATIVGRDAGEQIAGICVAMANGLGLDALGKAVLPHPTRAEYLKRIADQFNRSRLTPSARRLLRAWFRLTA